MKIAVADISLFGREKEGMDGCLAFRLGPSTPTDRADNASISTRFGPSPRGGGGRNDDARAEGNVSESLVVQRKR